MTKLPAYEDTKVGIPTSVYKYFDRRNILIYVGITSGGILRNRQHNDSKAWWPFVHRQEVEHFKSRGLAHEREVALIEKFQPPFNKQHNRNHDAARKFYLDMAEGYLPAKSIPVPLKQNLSLPLRQLSVNPTTREVEFEAPYDGVCATLKVSTKEKQVAPMHDQNGDHIGHVCRIENSGLFLSVFVRYRRDAYLNCKVESATAYLKRVEGKEEFRFKRIAAIVTPSIRQAVA